LDRIALVLPFNRFNVSYTFTGARDSSGHATLNNNIDEIFIDGKR